MVFLKFRGARVHTKAKMGRCEGAKPYGDLAGEADVIQRMKALRAEGLASIGG